MMPVIVMCRTGRRSAIAASLLGEVGFTQVYSVIDGYEGDGPGMKGWKGAGLPWRQAAAPARSRTDESVDGGDRDAMDR